ncbi:MAG: nucleoside deaminase [Bacilli bacterium]|nr:nucleoside deaminase [Bacilli bacterium]
MGTNADEIFMRAALEEAQVAFSMGEVPVGAVIVCQGEVIAKGHNTREGQNDISGHAEINAIKEAERVLGRWTLEGCTLYVTLEPCLMCAGAIRQSRLSCLVFGARDEEEGAVVSAFHAFDKDNGIQNVVGYVLEEECSKTIKDFFAFQRDKKRIKP